MKKGFTLIEMLAIVILLGVIGLIATTTISGVIKDNQKKLYDDQIINIINGAKNWAGANVWQLPNKDNEEITLTLIQLKQAGFVENDIKDPITKENFPNDLKVKITKKNNNYTYEIVK
ncbi:MAG: prepilin-type N-terminal cleavage/methylation domain-containing protein [Bacilli bacterium]